MVSTTAEMPELVVQLGDIATADADVVVVSANTMLDFEGRAGQAIADACGPQVAVELATIKARRTVRVGEVCATGAGRHHRIKAIFWAVVRGAGAIDDADDEAAVETAARALWRALLDVKRKKPFILALVPVGAIEIGSAKSAAIFARTLAGIPQLHPRLARVVVMTNRAVDVAAIEAALQPFMKAPPRGPRAAKTALTPLAQRTQQAPVKDTAVDGDDDMLDDEPSRSEDPTVPLKAPRPPKGWSDEATTSLKPPRKPR
jgi:O-acetyl-ADP-ribose deacetylase (regulator of RNase III)